MGQPFDEGADVVGGREWPARAIRQRRVEAVRATLALEAGEVVDLDANTGGYNLQIAFSTGWLAGESAARKILGPSSL